MIITNCRILHEYGQPKYFALIPLSKVSYLTFYLVFWRGISCKWVETLQRPRGVSYSAYQAILYDISMYKLDCTWGPTLLHSRWNPWHQIGSQIPDKFLNSRCDFCSFISDEVADYSAGHNSHGVPGCRLGPKLQKRWSENSIQVMYTHYTGSSGSLLANNLLIELGSPSSQTVRKNPKFQYQQQCWSVSLLWLIRSQPNQVGRETKQPCTANNVFLLKRSNSS